MFAALCDMSHSLWRESPLFLLSPIGHNSFRAKAGTDRESPQGATRKVAKVARCAIKD